MTDSAFFALVVGLFFGSIIGVFAYAMIDYLLDLTEHER